jgi:hypothetical protein
MSNRLLVALALSASLFAACGLTDLTLGKDDGIAPIAGSTVIEVPQDFQCGDPISDPNDKYTVTTTGTADACTFSFKQEVLLLKAEDYDSKPELKGAQLIKRVDIDVNKLAVKDAATGKALDQNDVVKDLKGKAFETLILTKADLTKPLPFTTSITGASIDALKSIVKAKQDLVVPVEVVVVLKLLPAPPAKLGIDFDAQPNIIVGF